ncbi:MAG: small basic family protein [Eubacteriaceae bacterium]|nr:small basic family protein [Eubacteriaceae bacterium]
MLPLLGLILGIVLGSVVNIDVPLEFAPYLSIGVLAAINSVFGGVNAELQKIFDQKLFVTGFFGNILLAIVLTFLGDKIGLPIYYAAIFYFGTSLFSNFAKIRRYYFRPKSARIVSGVLKNKKQLEKNEDVNNEYVEENLEAHQLMPYKTDHDIDGFSK